ncbi:hypothetical protein KHU50_001557 [Colletotrichum sp. SAR 10_65]|nr:hypothetical protein K4K51_003843 [Colletotrichum sp. SAR 10_75]KAI8185869.1 hypothetical protein KHU50_001557 [Colletotrichum sp. SAR 10_65]
MAPNGIAVNPTPAERRNAEQPTTSPANDTSADAQADEDVDNDGVTKRRWRIFGIANHRPDPEDASRLQLLCCWHNDLHGPTEAASPPCAIDDMGDGTHAWEPEAVIQMDAPSYWRNYVNREAPRGALHDPDLWHVLQIKRHWKRPAQKFDFEVV